MPNEFDAALSHFTPDPKALAEARKKRLKKADSYEQGYREGQQIREEQERAAKQQLQEQERLDQERAKAEAQQADLARKQRLADTERAYAREGRPTRTDAMGEIFTVDDDETWQRKQAEKKVAEDLKAQSRADAAFRKSEAVRLNQAETNLKAGLDDFDTAEAIGSQAVSAKASEIISLSQAHKAASDDTLAPAQRTQITSTPDYQQWLAGQPPESKDNPFAIGDYLATRIQSARKEKELLENSERTIKVAKLNKEQELKPALGAIQQKRDVLPITTAPAIPKGAGVTLQNTVSTATPTPASADPERAAAVLRTQITALREKGDFARADALERRLTNPAKWEAEQRAFRQTATPEQLVQTLEAGNAEIEQQWQATQQTYAVLSQQRQAYLDRMDRAAAKNATLLDQPYSDGDVAAIQDETTGEVTRWHKAAAAEYNGALQGLNGWQQANQEKIDLLDLNRQQLQIEAQNLKKHENQLRYLGREQQRQQDGEKATYLNNLRQTPGMAEFADETERRSAEFKQRQSEIERKYAPLTAPAADETTVQEAPEEFARKNESRALQKTAALRALQEEAKASDISMQERMKAKEQNISTLYTDWATGTDEKGRPTGLNITDWLTDDSVTPRLQQEAKARGLTEQEARKFLDYARKADWTRPLVGPASRGDMRGGEDGQVDIASGIGSGLRALIDGKQPDEPSRNLPNGTLSINPDLHLDKAAYMQAVQDAPSSPQAKKLAREQFTKLHELAGAQAVAGLENEAAIIGLPDFNNWRAEKLQNSPDFARKTLGTQATEFIAEMKARPATAKYADTLVRKVAGGLAQVASMISGATALVTGPVPVAGEWFAKNASEGLQLADMLSGQVGAKGGADTIGLRAGSLLAELVPQLLPMMAGGGLLSAGGKISPMVAASLMGGVQTAGLQQASVYQNIRSQIDPETGKPYTHLEAWSRAAPGAIASGIVTGLLTTLGGKTGGEAALAGMMSQAGREAARKALRESYKNVWATMKTITGHGIGEYLEEAPDELFSQISEEISTKGNSADLGKVIAGWIELQPELMLAVTAMGSGAGTVGDLVNRKANEQALLAEDLAAAAAEIENYQDATLDQSENDHRRNRAMLALAIARGVGIDGIDESILNSAGWTRKNPDGITRADGSLTKIKGYASQNVLDVDSDGRVKLDADYVKNLGAKNGMPTVAGLVGSKQTTWHKPGQIEEPKAPATENREPKTANSAPLSPAPASPAPSAKPSSGEVGPRTPAGTPQTRGTSAQGAAPVTALDTGGKTQAAAPAVSGAAAVPAHAPNSKEAVAALLPKYPDPADPRPQRAWEIANHLEMAGLDRPTANIIAANAIRFQGIVGKTVNEQVTSPEFNTFLDEQGATGDRSTREGTEPLKISQPTASQNKASPAPAQTKATAHADLKPHATPELQAQEQRLTAQGVRVITVETDADAEKAIGAPLKSKGKRGVTVIIDGKPVVVFIASAFRGKPAKGSAVIAEEFHHAAALLVLQNNPQLLAKALQEAANLANGSAIYSNWNSLTPTAKLIEAAAAYAAGTWNPDQSSPIRQLVDAIINAIRKAFNLSADEAAEAATTAIRQLADSASDLLATPSKSPAKPAPAAKPESKGARPEYATLRDRLKSKDISTVDAVREVIRLSGETDTGVLQDLLTDHLGLKKPSAAAAVETLRAAGELKGDKNDDISIAAGKRASDRQSKPSDKAYTAAKEFVPATQGALAENPAWARAKLGMLARTPPARRRWTYRFLTHLENSIAPRASLYDAIALGETARKLLGGNKIAVTTHKGKITLAIDLDRMVRDFSYLGDPRAAATATAKHEDIHAAQKHLERAAKVRVAAGLDGGKWTHKALAQQWRDLPAALQKAVWEAYNNVKASDNQSMPTRWDDDAAYAMQSEFLRMLVEGSIDPKAITEAVDAAPDLIQRIKDLLADLYDTLRSLIKGLPVSQAVTLDQQVTELKTALEQLGKPSTAEELRTKLFLRDPAAVAMQALKNGTVFDQLATQDALFTPEGLRRVWDLLTPEMRAQVERLKKTAAPWLAKKRTDNAALTRDLLTFLLDPRAAEALAQVNLTGSPAATASTGMVRRALRAMSDYFRSARPDFAQTLGSLDLPTAQVLQQMQSLLVNARAQFEASAAVQKLPTLVTAEPQADDEDARQAARRMMPGVVDRIQRRLSLPPDRVGPPTAAELSAQAMVKTWLEAAVTEKAFFDAANAAAEEAMPGVSDAARQKMMERWQASQADNTRRQKIDEEWNALVQSIQERVARQFSPWKSARESAEAIEALIRQDIQQAWAAAILATAAQGERRYYLRQQELTPVQLRQIESLLQVANGDLALAVPYDQRAIGIAVGSGAPVRQMGLGRENALSTLGIRIGSDGTAYAAANAPVYIEGGTILIKQSTLDDLSQTLPITRRQFRLSEDEQRARIGLRGAPQPVTAATVAEARAAEQQQQDTSKSIARLEQLEAQDRTAEKTSVKPVPLIDPNADPKTGKLHRGERGDLISWLGDHGSLGWPDSKAGGEWDWFLDLLGDYYNAESTGRTRKKALRDSKGNVIGFKEAAVQGTKLGMTNTAKKMAREGNLSTPAAIVEYLIQEGVVTPAIPTEDGSPRNLSLHENIGDRTGIDAIEEAAREANHDLPDGIGNAVMTALDGREAARTNRQNDPERAAELQTLRFERDTRSGPVAIPAHELAPLSDDGPTFITARSLDGDTIPLEVASYEWQPIDPDSAEADDYLEGHPAWRGAEKGNPERLVITLRGGTYYGQQTIPGDTLLRVEDAGNTGIGMDLGDGKGDFVTDEEQETPVETTETEGEPSTTNEEPGTPVSTNPTLEAEIYAELRKAGLLASSNRLRPAIRNAEGKIIVGRPGELHFEIARRDWLSTLPAWQKEDLRAAHERFVEEIEADKVTWDQGYHSDKTGFITGEEAIQYLPDKLQKQASKLGELNSEMFGMEDGIQMRDTGEGLLASSDRLRPSPLDPLSSAPRFYSQLARTVEAKMPNRADAKTLRGILENPQNRVKAEELKWSGILAWADSQPQPLTKQQVLEFLATEGSVRFEETRLGQTRRSLSIETSSPYGVPIFFLVDAYTGIAFANYESREEAENAGRKARSDMTRNTQWTLPGGENHREVVVTWKQKQPASEPEDYPKRADLVIEKRDKEDDNTGELTGEIEYVARYNGIAVGWGATEQQAAQRGIGRAREMFELRRSPTPPNTPNSEGDATHYGDLDALAWFRANDREDGLLVEEFQSKWAALWKEAFDDFIKENYPNQKRADLTPEQKAKATEHANAKVPDAPWVSNTGAWTTHLFKRALADAVAEGKQWIGWTTGDTQADRYDLSKQVSKIGVTRAPDRTYSIDAMPTDGGRYSQIATGLQPEKLAEVVGKDLAAKIIDRDIAPGANAIFSGLDLKVGGEGMRKFYDDILVKEFGKYVKPWGGKVTQSEITTSTTLSEPAWQTFSKTDWDTFGGAESFENGDDPVLANVSLLINGTANPVTVVLDANGMQAIDGDGENVWMVPNTVFPGQRSPDWWKSAASAQNSVGIAWKNEKHLMWSSFDTILGEEATLAPKLGTDPIWRIDITPQMRKSVAAGQALFASARHSFSPELVEEARTEMKENATDPDYKGGNAWMTPDGRFINLGDGAHYDASGIVYEHGYGPAMAAGYVRITREGQQMFAEFFGPLTRRIIRQVRDGAIEQQINPDDVVFEPFAEQHYGTSKYDEETGDPLFAADRLRDIADDEANAAYAAGVRTYYDYLVRMKKLVLKADGFDALKSYMRTSWAGIADRHGLPEPTRAAAEADYFRLARQKSPAPGGISQQRPQGPTPRQTPTPPTKPTPSLPKPSADDLWEAGMDPEIIAQVVGTTPPEPTQADNTAAAAADLASLGEDAAPADAPSIFALPPEPDAPAMPDSPEERMEAGWNAHPEDEQLPSAPLFAKEGLDEAKPVNIQGGKSSLLARGIYNRAIAALARHAAAIGDMFFGTGTVTQYIHKAGLGKPGGHASEYSPWRASFLRQVTDPTKVEALARGARAGIDELKRVQEASRAAVTGSADFYQAVKGFVDFINSLEHSGLSTDTWNAIRKRAVSGYQTSLKDKNYTDDEFALKVEHFARVHGLKARVMIGMYQALPTGFDLNAYMQKVAAAQAWDKHLIEARDGQTSMFAPTQAEHPGPIPVRDDPTTTGLYIAAEMLGDNGISLDLATEQKEITVTDKNGKAQKKTVKVLTDKLAEPFTGLFDTLDWHDSARANNIEKLIRDYHQVFVGKTIHSANSWLLLPRLAREHPGIGFVIDPPYFGVPETKNGKTLIDSATGQPVRKGTSNYDSTTDIRTPDDLLRLFDSYVLPAWQSGAKFVLTNEWDDSAAVALRLRGATVVKIVRQGRKGDTPELVAYNFNPTDGTLRPHRISEVTPSRAFNALQRGAYPGTSHSGNLDPRLKLAARAAAEAQPEAARVALQQRQDASQLSRGNASGRGDRPVGADQRPAPRAPTVERTMAPLPEGADMTSLERAQADALQREQQDLEEQFDTFDDELGNAADEAMGEDDDQRLSSSDRQPTPGTWQMAEKMPLLTLPPAANRWDSVEALAAAITKHGQSLFPNYPGKIEGIMANAADQIVRAPAWGISLGWEPTVVINGELINSLRTLGKITDAEAARQINVTLLHEIIHQAENAVLADLYQKDTKRPAPWSKGQSNFTNQEWQQWNAWKSGLVGVIAQEINHTHPDLMRYSGSAYYKGRKTRKQAHPFSQLSELLRQFVETALTGSISEESPLATRFKGGSLNKNFYLPAAPTMEGVQMRPLHSALRFLSRIVAKLKEWIGKGAPPIIADIVESMEAQVRAWQKNPDARPMPVADRFGQYQLPLASSQRLPDIQTAVMIDGKPHTSGDDTHYFTTLDYIMRQLPAWQREDRSQALEKADTILTNDWLKQHNVKEGFLVDGKWMTRQQTLAHVRKLGLTTPLADTEDRDWFDTTDLYELRASPLASSDRSSTDVNLSAQDSTQSVSPRSSLQLETGEAAALKSFVNARVRDPVTLRQSLNGRSLLAKLNSLINRPAQTPKLVDLNMLPLGDDLQIVEGVVQSIPISVVNDLLGGELASKRFLYQQTVFEPLSSDTPNLNTQQTVGRRVSGKLTDVSNGAAHAPSMTPRQTEVNQRAERAANETNTAPSEAQKEAGNYAKGKLNWNGLTISIENPRGSVRKGTDANGKAWEVTMPHHYGYILGTTGKDKDHLDIFLGPDLESPMVFVINQKKPGNGHFDEHKLMAGFTNPGTAARGYLDSYSPGWRGYDSIVPMTLPQLKHWLEHGKMSEAVTKAPVVSNDTKPKPTRPAPTHTFPDGYHLTGPGLHLLPASIRAYHGTPHDIDPKTGFSTSKIGTGEGAQVYGWGLYFAEAMKVAEQYRRTLSTPVLIIGDKEFTRREGADAFTEWAAKQLPKDWPHMAVSRFKEVLSRFHYDVTSFVAHPDEAADDARKVFEKFLRASEVSNDVFEQAMTALGNIVDYAEAPSPQDTTEGRWYARAIGWKPSIVRHSLAAGAFYDMFSRIGWYASTFQNAPSVLQTEYEQTIIAQNEELERLRSDPNAAQNKPQINAALDRIRIAETALSMLKDGRVKLLPNPRRGNFYTVDILGDPEQFLQWDEPLSKQSQFIRDAFTRRASLPMTDAQKKAFDNLRMNGDVEARQAKHDAVLKQREAWFVQTKAKNNSAYAWDWPAEDQRRLQQWNDQLLELDKDIRGAYQGFGELYRQFTTDSNGTPKDTSEFLAGMGIKGVRYLDGSSRSSGQGTHNYVLFDDKLVRILEKNGQPIDTPALASSNRQALAASPRQILDATSKASFNHLDRWFTGAIARQAKRVTSSDPVTAATQAAAAWWNQDTPGVSTLRSLKELAQRELLPETVLPREIMSAMREMQIKQSMGQQKALDVGRALSDKPKFSDLHYPPEFVENPMHREAMFSAMEQGKVDTLPPALQEVAKKLRQMLVEAGREAVKQGRMNPDTFEGLRTNFMPRFTKEEAQASAGDFAKRFKLGVKDILAQRSTAFHITDTSRKDKNGLPQIVSHAKGKWRFDSQQARDAYYEDLINRQTLDGELAKNDMHWMNRGDARALRSITPEMLKTPATMTKEQRDVVARVQRQLRNQFKREDPYEPKDLVKDPVYAVMRYLAQMTHDNAVAEFFNFIDQNPDWTSTTEMKGFTEIPDNDRFGALAGKYVRKDIADQVLELAHTPAQVIQLYDTLLRLWKTGKTVLNPATHARNILGNLPFAQFAGNNALNPANWPHYAHALRTLREGGDEYRQLYETGVLGADYASTELRAALENIVPVVQEDDSTSPIRHLIALGNRAAQWGKAHSLANVATLGSVGATAGFIAAGPLGALAGAGIAAAANPIYRGALWAYRLEDDLFKAAAFFKARAMGMTLEQAAQHVRDWFPYYDKPTSTTLKFAGRTTMPFLSFFRESARIGAKAAKERPLSLAATLAIPTLITALSQAALGLDDEDMEDVKSGMRGKGAKLLGMTPLAGVPIFSMLIPWRTSSGQLQQIDLSSTHPMADFLANRVENWNNDPWWQAWSRSALANPMLGALYTAATGRDPFGDRTLWDSSYSSHEKAKAILGHAWKTAMPPLAPGGTNWTMLEQSTRRQANKTLALRSPAQAVGRGVLGVDVRNADPDIYSLADAFRKRRGLPVTEGNTAYPTDAAGRARKALFEELVQPQPDPKALAKQLQALNDLGKPVRTVADVLDILDYRRPDGVINPKELRVPFRASLAPEARRVLDTALREFQKARAATPGAFAKARQQIKPTTRAHITEP